MMVISYNPTGPNIQLVTNTSLERFCNARRYKASPLLFG
jgi:hypothetical protein